MEQSHETESHKFIRINGSEKCPKQMDLYQKPDGTNQERQYDNIIIHKQSGRIAMDGVSPSPNNSESRAHPRPLEFDSRSSFTQDIRPSQLVDKTSNLHSNRTNKKRGKGKETIN
ncbi:28272_t:CDS:2 [Gigaspora margarita]|uniref:28272_t:CDS:1 n=1 Tax=Gigaspora margarita TaxID=4874 RepID=A0ABN7WNW8_GIGMA|nr:28272_t:CDS:2 [Gigaspora margarita]